MKYTAITLLIGLGGWVNLSAMAVPPESISAKLGLNKIRIAGITVYYEACFEEKLPAFEVIYRQSLEKTQHNTAVSLRYRATPLLEDLYAIVGGDETLRNKQADELEGLVKVLSAPLFEDVTFYLIHRDTVKDYLRKGHALPNFSYDKQTDTASFMMAVQISSDSGSEGTKDMTFPLSSVEGFEVEVAQLFQMYMAPQQASFVLPILLHEIAEISILERLRTPSPDIRWFTDGMANVIAAELLRKHFSKDAAEQFLATYSTTPYQDIEKTILLRYWMQMTYWDGGKVPVASEEKLNYARYCFATYESQRLTEAHGIDCIGKIIDAFRDSQNKSGEDLLEAVHQITGEDMRQRFLRYQHFETPQEERTHYTHQYRTAKQEKNQPNQLFALARLLELSGSPFAQETLTIRVQLACLLAEMGHPEQGDQFMCNTVKYLSSFAGKEGENVGIKTFMVYAINADRPAVAADYAGQILREQPDDLIALTVQALTAGKQGRTEDAKELAEKIRTLENDPQGDCTRFVKQYLCEH